MKKILCLVMCVFLVIGLSACGGDISKVKTHDVDSETYSADDINSAVDTIEKEFDANWNGCTLTEIYYAGDDYCTDFQEFADRNNADEVIVLLSSFDVDSSGGEIKCNNHLFVQCIKKFTGHIMYREVSYGTENLDCIMCPFCYACFCHYGV